MAFQLTREQKGRIQVIVSKGAYSSVAEALDAAVSAIEAAAPPFHGTQEELASSIMEGLATPEFSETGFWSSVEQETNAIAAAHGPERRGA